MWILFYSDSCRGLLTQGRWFNTRPCHCVVSHVKNQTNEQTTSAQHTFFQLSDRLGGEGILTVILNGLYYDSYVLFKGSYCAPDSVVHQQTTTTPIIMKSIPKKFYTTALTRIRIMAVQGAGMLAWSATMSWYHLSVDPIGSHTDQCATPYSVEGIA